jgi:hypothetical protein
MSYPHGNDQMPMLTSFIRRRRKEKEEEEAAAAAEIEEEKKKKKKENKTRAIGNTFATAY